MSDCKKMTLYAQMFGSFRLYSEEKELNGDIMRSDMLLRLLAYVLYNREKVLTVQELSEILWPDDGSDNPAGALKNLMYRLRSILKKTWGDREFILTGRGSYQWNPEIEILIDAERFDRDYRELDNLGTDEELAERGIEAAACYRGRFLMELSSEYWVISLSTYYHSRYLSLVKRLAVCFEELSRYSEAENICRAGIQQDTLDEEIHGLYLKALIADNKQKLAMEHYTEAVRLLYDNLGVHPSRKFRAIYEEILKEQHQHETDITVIKEELQETSVEQGAYLCEYGVFRHMYVLKARSSERLGITVYLVLATLYPMVTVEKGSREYLDIIGGSMEILQNVFQSSLRSSDILCQYSGSQFLIMLPACQYENVLMVMDRVQRNYYASNKKSKVRIQYNIDEISNI